MIDFSKMLEQCKQEVAQAEAEKPKNGGSFDNKYPLLYFGIDGKLRVRLLFNHKSGAFQRKLLRHTAGDGKTKVPCLTAYGEHCPVCDAVNNVIATRGKDSGVTKRFGVKGQGFCYAQLISHSDGYCKDANNPIKDGDIVLLMYPKSVYEIFNKQVVELGTNVDKVFSGNTGAPFDMIRTMGSNNFPDYTIQVPPFVEVKSFATEGDYENALAGLPPLEDSFYPANPTEEIRTAVQNLADEINKEYMSGMNLSAQPIVQPVVQTVAPQVVVAQPVAPVAQPVVQPVPVAPVQPVVAQPISVAPVQPTVTVTQMAQEVADNLPFTVEMPTQPVQPVVQPQPTVVAQTTPPPAPTQEEGKPACFGNYTKCAQCEMCVVECECLTSTV